MCIVCRGERLDGFILLDCSGCEKITKFPYIKGLKVLRLDRCINLVHISIIPGLIELRCSFTKLTYLPHIYGLKKLKCNNTHITKIPNIYGLQYLDCSRTWATEIPIRSLQTFRCKNSYLTEGPPSEYIMATNHTVLTDFMKLQICKIQRWFRSAIMNKKIIRIMDELTPIYYAPEMKGGYFAKKDLEYFANDSEDEYVFI